MTKIAYTSGQDGNSVIYVMNADGSTPNNLMHYPATDGWAAWSPDGSKIVFGSYRNNRRALWVMNADGSNQVKLTGDRNLAALPSWSPDGTKIAYNFNSNDDGWLDLAGLNANGTGYSEPLGESAPAYERLYPVWDPTSQDVALTQVHWVYYQGNWYWDSAYVHFMVWGLDYIYPLLTSGLDWWPSWVSADLTAPVVKVKALPFWTSASSFNTCFEGADVGPAGLRTVEFQYRDSWYGTWVTYSTLTNPSPNSCVSFGGVQHMHTYFFRARGTDAASNVQPFTTSDYGDTYTTPNLTAPDNVGITAPAFTTSPQVAVTWSARDLESGVANYTVRVQYPGEAASTWLADITLTSAV